MPDPDLAQPDAGTIELLTALAARIRQLVLISGRDTQVLEERVPVPAIRLYGNHGLEERYRGESSLTAAAQPFVFALQRAAAAIGSLPEVAHPGVRVERKVAAISVHFRESREPAIGALLEAVLKPLAAREGLRLHPGRFVWEVRPAVDANKGTVIAELANELRPQAIVFIGDDLTDADAFSALRRLRDMRTVAVGVSSSEVQAAAFEDCDLMVDGVEGVGRFLHDLLAIG